MKHRVFLTATLLLALCLLLAGCAGIGQTQTNSEQSATATETYTVTFDAQGYAEIAPQQVQQGGKATKPEDPERPGYSLAGWICQGEVWSFADRAVSKNVTLTANWKPQLIVSDDGTLTGVTEAGKTARAIEIPATYNDVTVTSIGERAFEGCASLTKVTVPDSVTSIGDAAFSGCSSLVNMKLFFKKRST